MSSKNREKIKVKQLLECAKNLLKNPYTEIQQIIEKHINEELFEKKKYKWTGTASLGTYLIFATSSHYDWEIKIIKKSFKMTTKL